MARKIRDATLDTREARGKLKPRGKPYWRTIERGLHLGYRRLKGKAGTWWARHYLRDQQYEVESLGGADDLSDADGIAILDFWQAQTKARERMVARAHRGAGEVKPLTVRSAVESYIAKRDARDAGRRGRPVRSGAHRLERHVIGREQIGKRKAIAAAKLADVPLHTLGEDDLLAWRASLSPTMANASKQRTINDLKAALNDACEAHRKRLDPSLAIVIKHGLKADEPDETEPLARDNQILTDAQVTRLIRAAQEVDEEQGWDGDLYRMVVVLAATGARFSQVARMRVDDCQSAKGRLFVPVSRKGRGKSGVTRVPVGQDALDALRPALGRPNGAPLLERWRHRQVQGAKWERDRRGPWQLASELIRPWKAISERAKMPDVIPYALRHSSIVRGLKANLPIRMVAALHDTSVVMIERHYAKWIVDGLDELAARAVVPLVPQKREARVVAIGR